jgi:hypothetical protein
MYKLTTNPYGGECQTVIRLLDGACIPFDPANTDYQAFKQDLANGVALSDAEGTAMTEDQIKTFLETLP